MMNRPCVLAVDDDPVTLRIIEAVLESADCSVITAGDLASARSILEAPGGELFTCALIDYQLPDGDGTELLRWLHERESPVAAVMVTASEERALVKQTMVEGACNFLQKPVPVDELRQAVDAASSVTRERRRLTEMRRQVEIAAQAQHRLLDAMLHTDACVEYKFCPKDECGGDFLAHHRFQDGDEVFLVSDVSGHDVDATVQSSFFHGWMNGVLKDGGDVEGALQAYNRRLVELNGMAGSIAVTALSIQRESGCMMAWNCGGSPPVFVDWRGRVQSMGARSSSPLGWFDAMRPPTVHTGIPPGPVWIWTDGLESLADSLGATPLAVAYALLAARPDHSPSWLQLANDDVLVARIWPGSAADFVPPAYFHPLIAEEYSIQSTDRVDALQTAWRASLEVALPDLPGQTVYDILIGCREALLNALRHGCCGSETAGFQVLYNPKNRVLRTLVHDPGAGHAFDWQMIRDQEPSGAHLGLVLIHAMASRVVTVRNGAELTMDYVLSENFNIIRPEGANDRIQK